MRLAQTTFLLTALAAHASADVLTPVSQNRFVTGSAYAEDDGGTPNDSESETFTAPDFGPFSEAASGQATTPNALGSGGSWQDSTILPGSITAAGSAFANGEGYDFGAFGDGSGESRMEVTFDLAVASSYTLTGDANAYDDGSSVMFFENTATGLLHVVSAAGPAEEIPYAFGGTLAPGQYKLTVYASGSAYGDLFFYGYAFGEYDVALELSPLAPVASAYCTSGTTTNGCVPVAGWTGVPSATAPTGFTVDFGSVEGDKQAIIFYGVSGPAAFPWDPASTSFLCVKPPTQRTGATNSGGTTGLCDGTLSLDWNAYRDTHPLALGAPFASGDTVWIQGWFRDPASTKTTALTGGLEFTLCP